MKRLIAILGVLLLVGAITIPVMAHGPGWGRGGHMKGGYGGGPEYCPGYGSGYENLTDEQKTKMEKLHKEHYDEMAKLRKDIWSKKADLNSLLNATSPDAEKVMALQKEVSDLQANMDQARIAFHLEAKKIAPDARLGSGYGRGYGKGYGHGYGRGWHGGPHHMRGGGHGPGSCWN